MTADDNLLFNCFTKKKNISEPRELGNRKQKTVFSHDFELRWRFIILKICIKNIFELLSFPMAAFVLTADDVVESRFEWRNEKCYAI